MYLHSSTKYISDPVIYRHFTVEMLHIVYLNEPLQVNVLRYIHTGNIWGTLTFLSGILNLYIYAYNVNCIGIYYSVLVINRFVLLHQQPTPD